MELVWMEDFLEIVATRNFSTAAAARNISQPAFSRRIKALEGWLGVKLIDRRTYPIQLTRAGALFLPRCQEFVRELHRVRIDCQQQVETHERPISFSALHTIALFFFPEWIKWADDPAQPIIISMQAFDFYESIECLAMGQCDFAIVYNHPDGPPVLPTGPFESLRIGIDPLVPVSAVRDGGRPLYSVRRKGGKRVPYLAYSWNDGYLCKLVSLIHARQREPLPLATVYETSIAEGIKRMAMSGKGVGWLPLSCVRDAIERGDLCQIGGTELVLNMEVRIFRRHGSDSADLDDFWNRIAERAKAERLIDAGSSPVTPYPRTGPRGSGLPG